MNQKIANIGVVICLILIGIAGYLMIFGENGYKVIYLVMFWTTAIVTLMFIYLYEEKRIAKEIESQDRDSPRSNEELIVDLMHKSAELSEAGEEIDRLRLAVKTHRDQKDHNKCWMNDFRLHQALQDGKNSPLPNPQKVTLAEMLWGCLIYCPEQYQALSEKEKQMTEEIKEIVKKYLY